MNSSQLLARNARKYPHAEAVVGMGERYTYEEVDKLVNHFAYGLREKGIAEGDKVVLYMPNVPEFVITYFAVQRLGAVIVPINSELTLPEIEYVLEHSDSKALITHDFVFEAVEDLESNLLLIKTGGATGNWIEFNSMLAEVDIQIDCDLPASSESTILYTSGTTGKPKGVLHSYQSVLAGAHMMCVELEMKPESRLFAMMPLSHSAALHLSFMAGMLVGATNVLTPRFTPELLVETIDEEKITHFFGPPVGYLATAGHPKLMEADLSSMKWWGYGGSPVSKPEVEYIQKNFRTNDLVCIYGLTESGSNGTLLLADEHFMKAGSIGKRAALHSEIRIVNAIGNDVEVDEVGEVFLRGEGLMLGYYKDAEATAHAFIGDWLRTEDLAKVDAEGFMWLVDRKTDLIISGGKNIYPKEIEDVLLSHPAIKEAAVIGVPDQYWGEIVKAYFVATEPLPIDEIKGIVHRNLAHYKMPRLYEQVEELPRNASGEVLKQVLRESMKKDWPK